MVVLRKEFQLIFEAFFVLTSRIFLLWYLHQANPTKGVFLSRSISKHTQDLLNHLFYFVLKNFKYLLGVFCLISFLTSTYLFPNAYLSRRIWMFQSSLYYHDMKNVNLFLGLCIFSLSHNQWDRPIIIIFLFFQAWNYLVWHLDTQSLLSELLLFFSAFPTKYDITRQFTI